jgi:hypothetical protein
MSKRIFEEKQAGYYGEIVDELEKIKKNAAGVRRPEEFIRFSTEVVSIIERAAALGARGEALNSIANKAIEAVELAAKNLEIADEDIRRYGTPMMKKVYEEFRDSPTVVKDLRQGVFNKLKATMVTRIINTALEPELEPHVRELADILADAYRRSGRLEDTMNAAYDYFRRAKYGGGRLADQLFTEASLSLQHAPRSMQKFSRAVLTTCPGADVCGAQCYALHGNYTLLQTKRAIALRDLFVTKLQSELSKRVGGDKALIAGLLGATFAAGVKSLGFGNIVRLHDAGDFSNDVYLTAWMTAAKLLPNVMIYTYTKTFPNVEGMPRVWQEAVELYRALFGEPPPKNFNINLSGTATNYKFLAGAAEALTGLGINVPGVFFYAPANMDEYYRNREERWRELAAALVEAVRRTTGKKLVLEFEHGLGARRAAKSSENIIRLVDEITNYVNKTSTQLTISIPETAYSEVKLDEEQKEALRRIQDPYARSVILTDPDKMRSLGRLQTMLALKGYSYTKGFEGKWLKKKEGVDVGFMRPARVFTIPGIGEPVEVFIEPGGEKACSLCQRCVAAEHSPLKSSFKIRLSDKERARTKNLVAA